MYESDETLQKEDLNSLEHYGVKGQKWGLRKYQNPDGSYTELGKERRRVGYGKEESSKEDEKSSKGQNEAADVKIGGKAYKDMTRKELRAAKKRARHNEKERKAQREFNRDKRDAIDRGDLAFISKNISKFTNEEIDDAVNRYRKMETVRNLEAATRKPEGYYLDKALSYLNKASQASKYITDISNNINNAKKINAERKKAEGKIDAKDKEYWDTRKAKAEAEKTELELKKKRLEKKEAEADKKVKEAEKKAEAAAKSADDKEKEAEKNHKAYMDQIKRDKEILGLKDEKQQSKSDKYDEWSKYYKMLKSKQEYLNAKNGKNKKKNKNDDDDDDERNDDEELLTGNRLGGLFKKKSLAEQYSDAFKKVNKSLDYTEKAAKRLIEENPKKLEEYYKKYMNYGSSPYNKSDKSKAKSIHEVLPITNERDERWRKEKKTQNSFKVDKWVNEMKRKYMKERNMSADEALDKAEEYVDSWIDFYGKQRKR